jgi:hypothetical protein
MVSETLGACGIFAGGKGVRLTPIKIVCCAYECLRFVNYLSRSTVVDIQNLLVLGNVISNNMDAGVAWSLLGTPHCDALLLH